MILCKLLTNISSYLSFVILVLTALVQPLASADAIDDEDLISAVMARNVFKLSDALPDPYGFSIFSNNKVYEGFAWPYNGNSKFALLGEGFVENTGCAPAGESDNSWTNHSAINSS